jgi:hypothetical protein
MSDASSEKQDQILANQAAITANQSKLEEILANHAGAALATGYGLEPARTAANTCQASSAFAVRLRRM